SGKAGCAYLPPQLGRYFIPPTRLLIVFVVLLQMDGTTDDGVGIRLHIKSNGRTFPAFPRRGARAIKPLEREGGAVVKERRSAPFLLKLLTAPSAPAKERDHLLMAQPPRLGKAGNALPFDSH